MKDIIDTIRQNVHPKQIKFTSLFIKPYINNIMQMTQFLPPTANCAERLYCIENNITSVRLCKHCGKLPVKYYRGSYLLYCSTKCGRISSEDKIKNTCLIKYGAPWASQSPEFRQKVKATIKIKYGVDNVFKNKELIKAAVYKKLGVQNPMHDIHIKNKCIASRIRHHGDLFLPNVGNNETILLNQQELIDKCHIDRNFKIGMYNPDGYCKETNTIYEVYEKYHKYDKQRAKDKIRQAYIQEQLKCDFIIIWDCGDKFIENYPYNNLTDLQHHKP